MKQPLFTACFVLLATLTHLQPRATGQCTPQWSPDLSAPGFDGALGATIVFDDGSGSALYVAGTFQHAPDGTAVSGVARRIGNSWAPVGNLPQGALGRFTVFDDGNGPKLHVHGTFRVGNGNIGGVFAWDGVQWNQLGTWFEFPFEGYGSVAALAVYDDGAGPRLYAAGGFPGGVSRWSGTNWFTFGGGVYNGPFDDYAFPEALVVHDDGTGPALYVAGQFDRGGNCGSPNCFANVARSTGGPWTQAGYLGDIWSNHVYDLASIQTPSGSQLFASGFLPVASQVARFNGTSWTAFAGDVQTPLAMQAVDATSGLPPGLWFSGTFTQIGGAAIQDRARWDGSAWHPLGGPAVSSGIGFFTPWDDGSGVRALATNPAGFLELLDAGTWTPFEALGGGAGHEIQSLAVLHGPGGKQELFACGQGLDFIGGVRVAQAGRFDGTQWNAEPIPATTTPCRLFALDLGAGEELYATGAFAGFGQSVARVLKRTGGSWSALPDVPQSMIEPDAPLAVFDDGNGKRLYLGGATGLLRLEASGWTSVIGPTDGHVVDLCAFDDGSGPALFLGGNFQTIGGQPFHGIARWNGQVLDGLQGGALPSFALNVMTFATFDDGSGPGLYVGGAFITMGGVPCRALARWNGSSWSQVGGGVQSGFPIVTSLRVHDDGSGARLFVGGRIDSVGGQAGSQIAAWDGTSWDVLAGGITTIMPLQQQPRVNALASFDAGDGRGPDLFVGGVFQQAGATRSQFIARWSGCGGSATTFCFGDGSGAACPCGNASAVGAQAGCLNSLGTGGTMRVHGRASLSDDTLVLEGGSMPVTTCLYYQGQNVVAGGAGAAFGDGVKCTSGPFVRLGTKFNPSGSSAYPGPTDPTLSVRGHVTAPGTRHYQARYRNAAAFCTPDTFNYTSGVSVAWSN